MVQMENGSLKEDHEMLMNCVETAKAANVHGQYVCPRPKFKKMAKESGFVNINEHVFKVPYWPWPEDPRLVKTNSVHAGLSTIWEDQNHHKHPSLTDFCLTK